MLAPRCEPATRTLASARRSYNPGQRPKGGFLQNSGSGGLGAVSVGVSETVIGLVILVAILIVLFGLWKLAKLLAAAFSN
jgi:hypothetical protein